MDTNAHIQIINRYFELWSTQNSDGLSEIFSPDAKYIVHPFGIEEYAGLDAIGDYWEAKPVGRQIKPRPRVITQAFGNNVAFVEWETVFEKPAGGMKRIQGMLLLEFTGELIKELREHYSSIDE